MDATLQYLLYVSSATRMLSQDDIEHLLTKARERNNQHGVSGIILLNDRTFMQYIEGPISGIAIAYSYIVRDPLHKDIIEIERENTAERAFGDWLMAFRSPEFTDVSEPWLSQSAILHRITNAAERTPACASLLSFWQSTR